MPIIPPPPTPQPTMEAVRLKIQERAQAAPSRDYLGASSMGNECNRALYYLVNKYPKSGKPAHVTCAAEDGYRCEDIMAERLRLVEGIELWTHDENGDQYGFSDNGGKFQGHIDGVIRGILEAPKTPHIWEHKSKEEKYFNKLVKLVEENEKRALEKWDWDYYVQAQIYMRKIDLTRHFLTVTTPGSRKMTSCRTDLNPAMADMFIARAGRIIEMKEVPPRQFKDKNFYKCKMCDFSEGCWDE